MKLRAQSPDALRELQRHIEEAKRLQAIQAKKNDRKALADREREHFSLRPNDDPQRRLL